MNRPNGMMGVKSRETAKEILNWRIFELEFLGRLDKNKMQRAERAAKVKEIKHLIAIFDNYKPQ